MSEGDRSVNRGPDRGLIFSVNRGLIFSVNRGLIFSVNRGLIFSVNRGAGLEILLNGASKCVIIKMYKILRKGES